MCWLAASAIPVTHDGRHRGGGSLRPDIADLGIAIAVLITPGSNIITKVLVEARLGFGCLVIWRRRMRSRQVPRWRSTATATGLKDVPRADPCHRPSGAVIDDDHGAPGGQVILHEGRVRVRQPARLDAEIAHPLRHQDVL